MGLFDSLLFPCMFCGETIEEQTKSGPSCLDEFKMADDLPVWLMLDLNGVEVKCHKCQKKQKLIFDLEINLKRKAIEPVDNLDWIEFEAKNRGLQN